MSAEVPEQHCDIPEIEGQVKGGPSAPIEYFLQHKFLTELAVSSGQIRSICTIPMHHDIVCFINTIYINLGSYK